MPRRKIWMSLSALSTGGALRLLGAAPGTLLRGVAGLDARERFERHWAQRTHASSAVGFPSARSAITALLLGRGIGPGDEVLVTGYTCSAVAEAVVASGATPVWVDVDPLRFSMTPEAAREAVGPQTRVMIIQHTYGIPAEIGPLIELARDNDLYVIEDAALALGSSDTQGPLGGFGDAAVYSFEVSKAISAGWGGLAQDNTGEAEEGLRQIRGEAGNLSRLDATRRLIHAGLGRFALAPRAPSILGYGMAGLSRLGILHDSARYTEPTGPISGLPGKYFAAPAGRHWAELDRQLQEVDRSADRARSITDRYVSVLAGRGVSVPAEWTAPGVRLIRFPVICSSPDLLLEKLMAEGVEGGRWFDYPIAPRPSDPSTFSYRPGSCPVGEKVSEHMANLPLHRRLNDSDVDAICSVLDDFISTRPGEVEFMNAAMSGNYVQSELG